MPTYNGTSGDDSYGGGPDADYIHGHGGHDYLRGNGGNDEIYGGDGDDNLHGGEDNDLIEGGAGNDTLNGDDGLDTLRGHGGDDRLWLTPRHSIASLAGESIDGGEGVDTLQFDALFLTATTPIIFSIADPSAPQNLAGATVVNVERLSFRSGSGNDEITGGDLDDFISGNDGDDLIHGGLGNDGLSGDGGTDTIYGGGGNDSLSGGNDVSADWLYGGDGDDVLSWFSGDALIDGGAGMDLIRMENYGSTGVTVDLSNPDVETVILGTRVVGVERLWFSAGSGNDRITGGEHDDELIGNGGDDILVGGAGNDILIGGDGNDQLSGGAGNDNLSGGDGNDQLSGGAGDDMLYDYTTDASVSGVIDGGEGFDILNFRAYGTGLIEIDLLATTGMVTNVEQIDFFSPSGPARVSGGAARDVLWGNVNGAFTPGGPANYFDGRGGDDDIRSGGGDDTLIGGEGNDYISGGAGADSIYGGDGNDSLRGGSGADTLHGGDGDDYMGGDEGADTMYGGAGNDRYSVDDAGDVVHEIDGEGTDHIAALVSYTLRADCAVERLWASDVNSAVAMNLTGNDFVNSIYGTAGVNILNGGGGNDLLAGLGGDDHLIGGTGQDAMYGGVGNDTYYVDDDRDAVFERAGQGRDVVYTSVSYALAADAEVEVLSFDNLASTAALNLLGNAYANIIYGNAGSNALYGNGGDDFLIGGDGNDILVGGTGADTMYGGTGDDSYYIDDRNDVVNEQAGEGRDVVYSSISYELAAGSHVEILSVDDYAATTSLTLVGNDLNNEIYGNAGANVLIGGGGNDALVGGAGDDVYHVDASDEIYEYAGGGRDVVYASTSYVLRGNSHIEVLSVSDYGSTAPINLAGNEFDNLIYGNAGSNVIDGKGGNDILIGMGGADTFAFTTAPGSNNVDSIIGFDVADDTILLAGGAGNPFAAIEPGGWSAAAFTIGNGPTTAEHRIIYHQPTGALYYDADGGGAGAAVLFALLTPGLNLAATNFTVTGGASAAANPKMSGMTEEGIPDWVGGSVLADPAAGLLGPVTGDEDGSFAAVAPAAFASPDGRDLQFYLDPALGQQELAPQPLI
jgi:Ca2+-binding RTX toxin-like protein